MEADFALMRRLAFGAVRFEERDGALAFHRFTEEQRAALHGDQRFVVRSFSDSGVRLEFLTDARGLSFAGRAQTASSRDFYFFDVYVNGALCYHPGHDSFAAAPEFAFACELPEGANRVAVYFPGLAKIELASLTFPGATRVDPVVKSRRILCYGDSITQGYDARYPSLSYANLVADALDAEVVNKAIGGSFFNPDLARLPDAARFDLVTVAYGTNDWSHHTAAALRRDATNFFAALVASHPATPIYALLPLWRSDCGRVTAAGSFADAARAIREAASPHANVKIVDGWLLLPHLDACVTDGLHPNDFGSQFVARGLLRHIR